MNNYKDLNAKQLIRGSISDMATIMRYLDEDGYSLYLANTRLRNTRKVALKAALKNVSSLNFISHKFKDDLEFMTEVVLHNYKAICFAGTTLRDTESFILCAIKIHPACINYASKRLKEKLQKEAFIKYCLNLKDNPSIL